MPRIVGTATQGSADAFVAASVATALLGNPTQAARVKMITLEFDRLGTPSAGINLEMCLSRYTKAAMPTIIDNDVLFKRKVIADFVTSGGGIIDSIMRQSFSEDDNLLIIEDPIYLLVDSNASSLAHVVQVAIDYELVKISSDERVQLLQLGIG